MSTKEVLVQFAEACTDLVRWRLSHDEQAEEHDRHDDNPGAPDGDDRSQWVSGNPAEEATGSSEGSRAKRRVGHPAKNLGESGCAKQEQENANANAVVVVNRAGVPEQPERHQYHHDRQSVGDRAKQPTEGPRVDDLSRGVAGQEPEHNHADDRKQNKCEGNTIAALFLGELLGTKHAEGATSDVGHRHPGFGETGVIRGCRGGRALVLASTRGFLGARRSTAGVPRARRRARSHASTVRVRAKKARNYGRVLEKPETPRAPSSEGELGARVRQNLVRYFNGVNRVSRGLVL